MKRKVIKILEYLFSIKDEYYNSVYWNDDLFNKLKVDVKFKDKLYKELIDKKYINSMGSLNPDQSISINNKGEGYLYNIKNNGFWKRNNWQNLKWIIFLIVTIILNIVGWILLISKKGC